MNVYEIVTGKLIAALERGTVPWRRPWRGADGAPRNLASGKSYRGINALLLGLAGYSSPTWGTINQINAAGGRVRRGERSTLVVFWRRLEVEETDADGDKVLRHPPMIRYYLVFNTDQCDGLKMPAPTGGDPAPVEPLAAGLAVVAGMPNPPEIVTGGRACYVPVEDRVEMPESARFVNAPEYYSTLFHELAHSTGHEKRLNRNGITVTAAGQAQKAADYILNRPNIAGQSAGQGA